MPERARHQIQRDLKAGRVRVDGHVRPARYRVQPEQVVEYDLPALPEERGPAPEAIELTIVYEDEHLLVIDKPAGLVVHPAPGHPSGTLVNALLHHCGGGLEGVGGADRWGIVHRLDKMTSGLMVAAKTAVAYERLVEALAERRVRRRYLAIVAGSFRENEGTIERPVGRRRSDRKRMGVTEAGRWARTDWRVVCQGEGMSLAGLRLHTGRTHQIRVHLQSIGRPVLGDPEYGWTRRRVQQGLSGAVCARVAAAWPERPMLHAARLAFEHPCVADCRMSFRSAVPEDMGQLAEAMWGEAWRRPVEAWYAGADEEEGGGGGDTETVPD